MSILQELRALLRFRPVQLLGLTGFLATVGGMSFFLKFCVLDNDIWWHLKVGDWIIAQLAVPHNGILSRTAADRPWVAYSWGYEVLMSLAYKWLGLIGIGLYGTLLTVAVAYAIYWMLRHVSGRFWLSLALAVIVCSAFLFNLMPRPVFFSIVLFCVTLALLLEANRTGRVETLYWLPLIFVLWANLHIQFIYGLLPVGLLVAITLAQHIAKSRGIAPSFLLPTTLPSLPLLGVLAACLLATLIGPNTYHVYGVVLEYSQAKLAYSMIIELQPLGFRHYSNYVELLLGAAGFMAIGWQKKIDLFKLALMVIASVLAFRTMRDAWFLCIPAAACVAAIFAEHGEPEERESALELTGVFAGVAIMLLLLAGGAGFTTRGLDRAISATFPVDAINFLRKNQFPGPIYNTFDWGGFLMWYMPQYPVSIDGRNDLYGDQLDGEFLKVQSGDAEYKTDVVLNESGIVLVRERDGLASALKFDPRFRKVYEDGLATVFVRQ